MRKSGWKDQEARRGRPILPAPIVPTHFENLLSSLNLDIDIAALHPAVIKWVRRYSSKFYVPEKILDEVEIPEFRRG